MKKYLAMFFVAVVLMTAVACQGQGGNQPDPGKKFKTLQERLESIVDASGIEGIMTGRQYRQIGKDDAAFFIGTESFNGTFKECIALEPEIDIDAFVLGLFELEEGADVMAFAKEISDKANPTKWICVGAEDKYVAVSGSYVLFVMSSKADITKIAVAAGYEPGQK